jgi:hypothetical protein
MRQIEAALAREQELAPHRGHGIKQVHHLARLAKLLRRHQTSRTATHHNHGDFNGHGAPAHCFGLGIGQRSARWQISLYRS